MGIFVFRHSVGIAEAKGSGEDVVADVTKQKEQQHSQKQQNQQQHEQAPRVENN